MNNKKFSLGFSSLNKEIVVDELPVRGVLPSWLSGTLVRNGPAKFEVGEKKLRHWFDGFSMLHKFSFENGKVSYSNKFLESSAYKYARENGKLGYTEFATDPCRSIFNRLAQMYFPFHFSPKITDNANVNISKIDDAFVALTETPLPIEFDFETLKTIGGFKYEDNLDGFFPNFPTAHPHYDFENKETVGYFTKFSLKSSYTLYRLKEKSKCREIISTIPLKQPGYIHSFGLTKNYIILVEFPFLVNPLTLFIKGSPFSKNLRFIENYRWKPEKGTRFFIIEKKSGKSIGNYVTEPFFAFHHINAFEEGEKVIVDIVAYPNPEIIQSLYLDVLRGEVDKNIVSTGEFRRYQISLKDSLVKYDVISKEPIELPRINYSLSNTKNYRFAYGVGSDKNNPNNFLDRLVKINIQNRSSKIWKEEGCYPGEPIFLPSPNATKEDEGIIISVVLNTKKENSFLLILDAETFTEIARAEVSHHIPFGFHGQFYGKK